MDLEKIKSIGETANTCPNHPEYAFVLIRELCSALLGERTVENKAKWNGKCRCGHFHDQHNEQQRTANYSAGKCSACKCKYFIHAKAKP